MLSKCQCWHLEGQPEEDEVQLVNRHLQECNQVKQSGPRLCSYSAKDLGWKTGPRCSYDRCGKRNMLFMNRGLERSQFSTLEPFLSLAAESNIYKTFHTYYVVLGTLLSHIPKNTTNQIDRRKKLDPYSSHEDYNQFIPLSQMYTPCTILHSITENINPLLLFNIQLIQSQSK